MIKIASNQSKNNILIVKGNTIIKIYINAMNFMQQRSNKIYKEKLIQI